MDKYYYVISTGSWEGLAYGVVCLTPQELHTALKIERCVGNTVKEAYSGYFNVVMDSNSSPLKFISEKEARDFVNDHMKKIRGESF